MGVVKSNKQLCSFLSLLKLSFPPKPLSKTIVFSLCAQSLYLSGQHPVLCGCGSQGGAPTGAEYHGDEALPVTPSTVRRASRLLWLCQLQRLQRLQRLRRVKRQRGIERAAPGSIGAAAPPLSAAATRGAAGATTTPSYDIPKDRVCDASVTPSWRGHNWVRRRTHQHV